jgi:hypothetical protein
MAMLWPSNLKQKKLPFPSKENQFNIHMDFNQNMQYPHAIVKTH